MDPATSYIFESYAIFQNADNSLLKLNPLIEPSGFKFVFITPDELENNFSKISYWGEDVTKPLTSKVDRAYYRKRFEGFFGTDVPLLLKTKGILLLKQIEELEHKQISENDNSLKLINQQINRPQNLKKFADNLLMLLRLIKGEPIYIHGTFHIKKNEREIFSYGGEPNLKRLFFTPYSLLEVDVVEFDTFWRQGFRPIPLVDLAIKNYNASYNIANAPTKFLLLMMCLESIFNNHPDQITHTISRHLSLVISNTKEQFLINYKIIKKLYAVRSKIAHGQSEFSSQELNTNIEQLSNLVRDAIKYSQKASFTREQLFEYLNAKGFES